SLVRGAEHPVCTGFGNAGDLHRPRDHTPRIVRAQNRGGAHHVECCRGCLPRIEAVLPCQRCVFGGGVVHERRNVTVTAPGGPTCVVDSCEKAAQAFSGREIYMCRCGCGHDGGTS